MSDINIFKGNSRDENIIMLSLCSCFLPFYMSIGGMALIFFYVLFNKKRLLGTVKGISNLLMYIFSALSMTVAFIYQNWFGMLASLVFFAIIVMLNHTSNVATEEFYVKLIIVLTRMSLLLCSSTFVEFFIHLNDKDYRCQSYCMNPNYLANLLIVSILGCVYLMLSKRHSVFFCFITAVLCSIALIMTGSISSWIAIALGLVVLLFLMKRYILLTVLLAALIFAGVIIYCYHDELPRFNAIYSLTRTRKWIFDAVMEKFKEAPLFGQGFFTAFHTKMVFGYFNLTMWHSHNLFLECLLCFGIIGSIIVLSGFVILFRRLIFLHFKLKNHIAISCFVIAVSAATVVDLMFDLSLFWVQSSLLGAILVGGCIGAMIKSRKKV